MLGIAFEGCACRAAFHAGVAAGLDDAGLRFPLTAGASSGSLIATGVAAGRARDLPDVWRSLGDRSIVSLERALWNRSIFDMSHLVRSTLRRLFGAADLRQAPSEALVTATRLRDLRCHVLSSRTEADMVAPLLASCFLPILYGRPIKLGADWFVDGGLTDNLPLEALAARGANEVIAVVTSHEGTTRKTPWRRNWRPHLPGLRTHVIHPEAPLAIRSWDLGREAVARAVDAGYAAARRFAS